MASSGQLVERDRQPPGHRRLGRQLVVASPDVLDEGVPCDDHPGAAVLLECRLRDSRGAKAARSHSDSLAAKTCSRRMQQPHKIAYVASLLQAA